MFNSFLLRTTLDIIGNLNFRLIFATSESKRFAHLYIYAVWNRNVLRLLGIGSELFLIRNHTNGRFLLLSRSRSQSHYVQRRNLAQ